MTKRDWKAITIDYAAMAGYDNVTPIALCLTQQQVAILKACLIPQYWATRWDNLTLDAQALNEFVSEIDYALDVECGDMDCDDVMDCVDDDPAYVAMTGYALDVLVSNSKARDATLADDYDGTAQSIGADIPVGVPDTDEQNALCYALEKFVNFYAASKRAQISLASGWRVMLDEIQSAAINFYNWIAPYVAPSYIADIFACWVDFEAAFTALADQDALDELACCLLDELDGVAMSQTNFDSAISACASSLTGTAGDIACVFDSDNDLDLYLVFLTGYQIAIERVAAEGNLPCNCDLAFYIEYDFTVSNGGWILQVGARRGEYVAGVGWQSTPKTPPSGGKMGVYIYHVLPSDCALVEIAMDYNMDGQTWSVLAILRDDPESATGQVYMFNSVGITDSPNCAYGNLGTAQHRDTLLVGLDDATQSTTYGRITAIRLKGYGTKPSGYQNDGVTVECP